MSRPERLLFQVGGFRSRCVHCLMFALLLTSVWGCGPRTSEVEAKAEEPTRAVAADEMTAEEKEKNDQRRADAIADSARWGLRPPWEQPDDALVATVDEEQILKGDIMEWAFVLLAKQGMEADSEEGKLWLNENASSITDTLITYRILRQMAEKEIPAPTDEEVNAIIAENQKQFVDQKALEEYLGRHKLTLSAYREILRMDLQFRRFVSERSLAFAGPEPTEAEVRDYYNKNKSSLVIPTAVKYREIFLYAGNPGTEAEWEDARVRAEKVASLLQSGSDFARLVKEYSQSSSNRNDGVMPYVLKKDVLDPSLATALFNLKKGQTSPPIRVKYGYMIVEVLEVKPRQVPPLDAALTEIIKKTITDERMKTGFKDWLNTEWKKHLIVIAGKVINDPYGDGTEGQ